MNRMIRNRSATRRPSCQLEGASAEDGGFVLKSPTVPGSSALSSPTPESEPVSALSRSGGGWRSRIPCGVLPSASIFSWLLPLGVEPGGRIVGDPGGRIVGGTGGCIAAPPGAGAAVPPIPGERSALGGRGGVGGVVMWPARVPGTSASTDEEEVCAEARDDASSWASARELSWPAPALTGLRETSAPQAGHARPPDASPFSSAPQEGQEVLSSMTLPFHFLGARRCAPRRRRKKYSNSSPTRGKESFWTPHRGEPTIGHHREGASRVRVSVF